MSRPTLFVSFLSMAVLVLTSVACSKPVSYPTSTQVPISVDRFEVTPGPGMTIVEESPEEAATADAGLTNTISTMIAPCPTYIARGTDIAAGVLTPSSAAEATEIANNAQFCADLK